MKLCRAKNRNSSSKFDKQSMSQIFWFLLAGSTGFMVDAGLLELVTRTTDIGLILGRIMSFSVAIVVTWQLNRSLTFKRPSTEIIGVKSALLEFFKYLLSSCLSIAINFGIYAICIFSSNIYSETPSLAVAVGSIGAMFVTFLASKYWVFK